MIDVIPVILYSTVQHQHAAPLVLADGLRAFLHTFIFRTPRNTLMSRELDALGALLERSLWAFTMPWHQVRNVHYNVTSREASMSSRAAK